MGMFRNFFNRFLKSNPTWPLRWANNANRPVFNTQNYKAAAEEGYELNDVAFSSIDKFAKNFAQIDFKLFEVQGSTRREIEDHTILDLIDKPNPRQGKEEFMEALAAFRLLSGNPYINGVPGGSDVNNFDAELEEMYLLKPDLVKIMPGEFGIAGYEYSVNAGKIQHEADQITGKSNILHWPTFSPTNDLYGFAPIQAAGRSIDISNEAQQWNMGFFQNGTRPSGALVYSPKEGNGLLDDNAYDRLKTRMTEHYSGSLNTGRPMFLEGGMTYQEMSGNPKDVDFIMGSEHQARNIARVLGIPPMLLNIPGDNTYNNMAESKLGLWDDSILPWGKALLRQYNYWLVPRYGDNLQLVMDLSKVTSLEPRREAQWKRANEASFLTINEKRAMVDEEGVEGGDTVYIESNKIPITFDVTAPAKTEKSLEYRVQTKSSDEELRREQIIQDRLMQSAERGFTDRMYKQLEKTSKEAEKTYLDSSGTMDVDLFMEKAIEPMEALLGAHYSDVYESFGRRVLNGLKGMYDTSLETKDENGIFETDKAAFVNGFTTDRVTDILETTRKQIQGAINAGKDEGLSLGEIASNIRDKTGGDIARNRAITIARTETHSAAQVGSHGGATATGLDLVRIWVDADDGRERSTHHKTAVLSRAKPVEMNERFDVGGEKLLFPGDPTGSAKNIIQCRCVVVYEPRGGF